MNDVAVKKSTEKARRMSAGDLTSMGLLTGILLLMSFTPLGYIKLPGLAISFLTIPVGLGAMLIGPMAGLWLGFVFGATSFYQAMTGSSPFSAMLISISFIRTFLVCVPSRMLMGWLTGVVFLAAKKVFSGKSVSYFIGGFAAAFLNTLFFMGALVLLFWNTEYIQNLCASMGTTNPLIFVLLFVGFNAALELLAGCIVGGIVTKAVSRTFHMHKKEA